MRRKLKENEKYADVSNALLLFFSPCWQQVPYMFSDRGRMHVHMVYSDLNCTSACK